MKLVDILARELKVWPEQYDCLSQMRHDGGIINGRGFDGVILARLELAEDSLPAGVIVTKAQWQAAVDALKGEKVVAWHGDGLPPVGLTVEWYSDSQTGWQEIIVLAYHGMDAWIKPKGKSSTIVGNIANFRPIRTPEQIAAEEMANGVREMRQVMAQAKCGRDSELEALWLAGYRKFEIVDN